MYLPIGLPKVGLNQTGTGDLLIDFDIEFPSNVDDKYHDLLEKAL